MSDLRPPFPSSLPPPPFFPSPSVPKQSECSRREESGKKRKKKRGTFAQKVASTPLKLERALQTADLRFKVFFFLTDVLTHTLTKHRPGDGTGFWDCTCIDIYTHTHKEPRGLRRRASANNGPSPLTHCTV